MNSLRFLELKNAGKPIFIEDEITEIAYDFTNYPDIRVKSKSGRIVCRKYDKTYDDDVNALLYGREISEEIFNNYQSVMSIEETLQIALDAHKGQKDLDGKPAILHPIAVGIMGSNDAEIKAGFLHDVVEDSDLAIDDLRRKGVEEEVLAALELLTHDKKTDYFDYVQRIADSGNLTAIHTKINDLKHNLERGRRSYQRAVEVKDTGKAERLAKINEKHQKALSVFGDMQLSDKLIF